jgi:hypothetical protein
MRAIPILTALLLAGCVTKPPPEIQTKIVNVAVPVPCKVNIGPDPAYPDTDADLAKVPYPAAVTLLAANPLDPKALNQMGENMLYLLAHYRAGRDLRIAREAKKQAALDECGKDISR